MRISGSQGHSIRRASASTGNGPESIRDEVVQV